MVAQRDSFKKKLRKEQGLKAAAKYFVEARAKLFREKQQIVEAIDQINYLIKSLDLEYLANQEEVRRAEEGLN